VEAAILFRRPKPVSCAVCGKAIDPKERRFVDKNRVTKVERHIHVSCQKADVDTTFRLRLCHD